MVEEVVEGGEIFFKERTLKTLAARHPGEESDASRKVLLYLCGSCSCSFLAAAGPNTQIYL